MPAPFVKKGAELYESMVQMVYGLRFENYGTYRFRIVRGDKVLASVPLTIIPQQPSTAAA